MDYILEFSSPEIKCCDDCRFYVCDYCDDYGCEYDRYCTAEASPLTDDPDLRMDWCPLSKKEEETNDASYTYYEIWNTTSERTSECTERCVDIETAKEHLANAHCDWCRPAGTGRIYGVTLVPTEDGSITKVSTMVYENNCSYN